MTEITTKIANELPALSHLECETCHTRKELYGDDAAKYLSNGWPKHCGYTMRLWTQSELATESYASVEPRDEEESTK